MRSLRTRLFIALLVTVLVTTGVSLGIGAVLTRDAVRGTVIKQLNSEADLLAERFALLPTRELNRIANSQRVRSRAPVGRSQPPPGAPGPPPVPGGGGGPPPGGPPAGGGPPDAGAPQSQLPADAHRPQLLTYRAAKTTLPTATVVSLRAGKSASGQTKIDSEDQLYAARPVGKRFLLVTRPAEIDSSDYGPYLTGLLVAAVVAALLAAVAALLLSRRLAAPLRRAAAASRALAAGKSPDPLPTGKTRELAQLAEAFNDMSHQLAQAREAERSIFLSVSHELRTPLTAIRGYAEGAEDGTIEPGGAASLIAAEAGRLERLVQDLLALARLDQGVLQMRRERIDLGEIAEQAGKRLRLEAERRNVTVSVEAENETAAIADPDRVLQVAANLVENAVRVTPADGQVTVTAAPGRIEVADTGPGIPAEDLPHTFERFHLRKRQGQGSADGAGIGLAIVRELTEAMGGTVSVTSEPGHGARFTVQLPPI